MGTCLWDLCLDKYTGDGRFDGESFLGRLWIFFLGGWGRGRGRDRASTAESFSQDDTHFQTVPFFMLYYILISGGFATVCFRSSRKVSSTSMSWTDTYTFQSSTTRRPVPLIEDSEGTDTPRSTTDSTTQWVWCFMHMWFMLHVISVICLV
jgi:hypothetical protein